MGARSTKHIPPKHIPRKTAIEYPSEIFARACEYVVEATDDQMYKGAQVFVQRPGACKVTLRTSREHVVRKRTKGRCARTSLHVALTRAYGVPCL